MLSGEQEKLGRDMMLAWKRIKSQERKRWGDWMLIGHGLMEGRRLAMKQAGTDRPQGRGYNVAFSEWLTRFKMTDLNESDRAKLFTIMEELPAIEEWRAADNERLKINHPTILWRKWRESTKEKKKRKPGTSPGEAARARALIEELQRRIVELEEELEAARERIAQLETELEKVPA